MPRTPLPNHLVHQPEEVQHNAELFDQLCSLAEEVAYPVVENALMRETAASAGEVLTSEAKLALEGLLAESALNDIDDQSVVEEVRKGIQQALPEPNEEECALFARDVAQVLMSSWVETLRQALSEGSYLGLSDQMLPLDGWILAKQFFSRLTTRVDEPFTENGIGALALEESEAREIMKTFRHKLFSDPGVIELPFELIVMGAPQGPVFAMTRQTFEDWLVKSNVTPEPRKQPAYAHAACAVPASVAHAARQAEEKLTAHLSPDDYTQLIQQAGRKQTYLYNLASRY